MKMTQPQDFAHFLTNTVIFLTLFSSKLLTLPVNNLTYSLASPSGGLVAKL